MAVIGMKQLLEAGVHFGHQKRRWNPKMSEYIYTTRNGIHIIDLQKTSKYIDDAYEKLLEIAKDGGKILFVGTKKQAKSVVKEEAIRTGQYYVTQRWLGGTLTNFKTLRKSINKLHRYERMEKDGSIQSYTKKERVVIRKEMDKLEKFYGGIKSMDKLPQALFVVDPMVELNAVKEARLLNIPVFGMVDTNCDPDYVDVIIPANDDAIRAIKVIVSGLANAFVEGAGGVVESQQLEKTQETNEKKEVVVEEKAPSPKKETPAPVEVKVVTPEPKEDVKGPSADLNAMSVADLRALAKDKGLSGYSKLKKAELIDLLK
jgi:small subunit ribosomal protein S2